MRSLADVLPSWLVDAWHASWELLVFNVLWLALTLPLVAAVIASNYLFYGRFQAAWSSWVQGLFLGLLFLWLLVQIYTFPLLLEQTERRVIGALRNILVVYLKRPGFSLGMALFLLAGLFLLTHFAWPTWLVITAGLSAYLANRATIHLVEDLAGERPEQD